MCYDVSDGIAEWFVLSPNEWTYLVNVSHKTSKFIIKYLWHRRSSDANIFLYTMYSIFVSLESSTRGGKLCSCRKSINSPYMCLRQNANFTPKPRFLFCEFILFKMNSQSRIDENNTYVKQSGSVRVLELRISTRIGGEFEQVTLSYVYGIFLSTLK